MKNKVVNKYISQALFELLKKYELQDISITMLIEKAGVGRSSFYRNYMVITDVITEYLDTAFEEGLSSMVMTPDNVRECVKNTFSYLLLEKEKLLILEKRGLMYLLYDTIYKSSLKQILSLDVYNNYYQPYFFSGASAFMTRAWVINNFNESPDELADIFMDSLKGYMKV